MENFGKNHVVPCDTIDSIDCVAFNSSGIDEGDLMLLESVMEFHVSVLM